MLEKFKRPAVLIAVIAALVLALIVGLVVGVTRGQEPREPAQATATPLPQRTVDPCAFGNAAKLANAILDAERPYEALERKVTAALNAVTPISLPGQLAGELTQAVQGRRDIAPENGYYTLSGSSGGTYVYDRPYSSLIYGGTTDTFTVDTEDGLGTETVDNTRYDPLSWVMSGEGGGDFAFASYYVLAEDGASGEFETVTRLNDSVSGWAHDEFRIENGRYWLVDVQLNLFLGDGRESAAYQWIICAGWVSADAADIREYRVVTEELALPAFPRLFEAGTDAVASTLASLPGDSVSHLTVERGKARFEDADGVREGALQ